jgi:hypothetical protein
MDRFDRAVRRDWDIQGLANDLRDAEWQNTERGRIDRRTFVASYNSIMKLTKNVVSKKSWAMAEKNGFEHDYVDDYINAVAFAVQRLMGEHVYGTVDEDDVFVGQYQEVHDMEPPGVFDWTPGEE